MPYYRMEYLIYGTIELLADTEEEARREFADLTATEIFDHRTNEVRDVKLFRVSARDDSDDPADPGA